jgi:eukaryotic-like serine/threonine-protein kinase
MDVRDAVTVPIADDQADDLPARLGRFELGRRLGAGGMGLVMAAHDTLLDRTVALKLLRPGMAGPSAQARLLREARALASLAHPNVVKVFEVGVVGTELVIAMELVEGETLREWMTAPHGWHEIVDMFVRAGRGLAAVHALGLIHRDFKPSNVLIDRGGTPKVGDFGLVGLPGDRSAADRAPAAPRVITGEPLTTAGTTLGTPAYMAPEQHAGRVDARADQYSFAVALVEALTGTRPEPEAPLAELAALPAAVRSIAARALAGDPARRYPSMEQLLAALTRAQGRRRRRWRVAAGLTVALGVAGLAVGALGRPGGAIVRIDPCPAPDAELAAIWGAAPRSELGRRLATIDPVAGAARFAAVTRTIEPFVRAWRDMDVDACRASRVRAEQSETLLALRRRCLRLRRDELIASLAAVAAAASPAALDRALAGLIQLTPLDGCADAGGLERTAGPADPVLRRRIDELDARLLALRVAARAGRAAEVARELPAVVAEAQQVGHLPAVTTALALRSSVEPADRAATTLRELAQQAARAHDDRTEAAAWIALIRTVGLDQGEAAHALTLVGAAQAAVLRAGGPIDLRCELLYRTAQILVRAGQLDEALARLAEAIAGLEASGARTIGSPWAPRLADLLRAQGDARAIGDDRDGAAAALHAAIAARRASYGPDSLDEADDWDHLGAALRTAGRLEDGAAAVQRAANIRAQRLGPRAGTVIDAR